jgi:hypothetical protein
MMDMYYTRHGKMSDPGEYGFLYDHLPTELEELVQLVQNITIHIFWAERYGLKLPIERMTEVQLRSIERRLGRTHELDARPLTEARPLETRLVGNCRDFALMLTSLLRHLGHPARARCGFGFYFLADHFEDHWVTEVWDSQQRRWVLVDSQLDAMQCDEMQIPFNPLDVPRDQFIVAGKAWQMCRSGEQDPQKFGIFDMHGLGFVRGNVLRDLAALNKMELLPWDCWGLMLSDTIDDPDDLTLLDEVAAITASDAPTLELLLNNYQTDARLFMDGSLISFVNGEPIPVTVG